ncbi:MAG TPA: HEAT repeat domain-containing protein [Balneolaceae bacterium]|nr:HEAT repeat domain-containing protein [Balneolaceae bacterium]
MSGLKNYFPANKVSVFSILFILFLLPAYSLQAQSFDYISHPKLDFNFNRLELDLGVQPQNLRIDGAAHYQLTANVSEADTVILYAAHLDISSASVNGKEADFMLHNDSLFVPLQNPTQAGDTLAVDIRYSGSTSFGLLKDAHETVWTSLLPKSQRHWIPIVDNPNVELKTKFNISVPAGFSVWATGKKTGQEAASVDAVTYHFESSKPVPASSLSFAIGQFNQATANMGDTKVNVVTEKAARDSLDARRLAQNASQYVSQLQDSLQVSYPFDQLSVIVLPDHHWETKSWGASTVFIYKNRGDLETQLLRGVIGQWFGVNQREAGWSQSDAINLYQTILYQIFQNKVSKLKEEDVPDSTIETVYSGFGVQRWNQWQRSWTQWDNQPVKKVISGAVADILKDLPHAISWNDYAQYWYRESGQPLFDMPGFPMISDTAKTSKQTSDSVAYKVIYSLNQKENKLKLHFTATHGVYKQLTTLKAYEIYPNKIDTSEVTFTGAQDSVMLQIDPTINTLRLETSGHPNLYLDEYKSASFLIYELRNAKSVDQKAEAARKLGYYSKDPDLQLAIEDFMNKQPDPKVKAALLSSLGDITHGASGTEDTFLKALNSDNKDVRDAALMALQHFKNNTTVKAKVEDVATNAQTSDLFQKATKVLTSIESPDQFTHFASTITQQDSVGQRSIFVIQQLANMGEVGEAVKKASLFTEDQFSYTIRSRALGILIQHDHTPSDWLSRAKELLGAADPRIRYLVVRGLKRNLNSDIKDYLNAHIQDEYDARVYHEMNTLISD